MSAQCLVERTLFDKFVEALREFLSSKRHGDWGNRTRNRRSGFDAGILVVIFCPHTLHVSERNLGFSRCRWSSEKDTHVQLNTLCEVVLLAMLLTFLALFGAGSAIGTQALHKSDCSDVHGLQQGLCDADST